jgi:hypothetical protein
MVERTVPTYVVGRVRDDDMAIRVAEGSIVRAKALSPEGGDNNVVLCSATARGCAAPAVSWRCMSKTNTVVAILAAVESLAQPAAFLSSVDTLSAAAGGRLPASTVAASRDIFFWALYSANAVMLLPPHGVNIC